MDGYLIKTRYKLTGQTFYIRTPATLDFIPESKGLCGCYRFVTIGEARKVLNRLIMESIEQNYLNDFDFKICHEIIPF